ncbi:hypothetical protein BGX27_008626 [Mortierella sp. AM989]|nr:hypothetical protein BGX27_008626 [Mortierella sp. AM989]
MSTASIASLWETFRGNPASENLYLPDSHIVFLPTGAGAAGEQYVHEFFKSGGYSHPRKLLVEEKVIHRTVGESSAVDEVEVTVKFVSGSGGWLLPGVEPHHLEDLTITFPLVICASIAENRIASVRYVWDNASVLKMVKLIGSRHSWPIVAETQIEALREPTRFRLNPFGNATTVTAGSRPQTGISKIFGSPPVSPAHQTAAIQQAVSKKGHPALTSTVFSNLKNGDDDLQRSARLPLSPSTSDESIASRADNSASPQLAKKGHPALTSTLFNHLKNVNPNQDESDHSTRRERALSSGNDDPVAADTTSASSPPAAVAKKGHPALTSTLFNHLKEQPQAASNRSARQDQQQQQEEQQRIKKEEEERGAGWRADYVKPKGHPALTSSIFSKAPLAAAPPSSSLVQEQQQYHHVPEEERGAGWRADYVKPKGHPALTSTIFSQQPAASTPTSSRPYKKTSHNIFGPPAEEPTKNSKSVAEEQQQQTKEYTLEPSAIEAELERHEQQQDELKNLTAFVDADADSETLDQLEKQIQEQEKLNAQEELEAQLKKEQQEQQEQQEQLTKTVEPKSPVVANAPLSPISPPQSNRRIHPNYRTSFTIGGPR